MADITQIQVGATTYNIPDTKNTTGSTDSDSKLFLVGATEQSANPQTYSDSAVYETNGIMSATKYRIGEKVRLEYNTTTNSLDFIFE